MDQNHKLYGSCSWLIVCCCVLLFSLQPTSGIASIGTTNFVYTWYGTDDDGNISYDLFDEIVISYTSKFEDMIDGGFFRRATGEQYRLTRCSPQQLNVPFTCLLSTDGDFRFVYPRNKAQDTITWKYHEHKFQIIQQNICVNFGALSLKNLMWIQEQAEPQSHYQILYGPHTGVIAIRVFDGEESKPKTFWHYPKFGVSQIKGQTKPFVQEGICDSIER